MHQELCVGKASEAVYRRCIRYCVQEKQSIRYCVQAMHQKHTVFRQSIRYCVWAVHEVFDIAIYTVRGGHCKVPNPIRWLSMHMYVKLATTIC
jgi:hypothetical protein